MDVELQATCSALGYLEGNDYIKEPDCLETVKDLIRFLRRDTDVCDIRRQLGNAQILQNDLIPLVKTYHEEKELFETVIKLLVNLTQPVADCFNNEIPDEKTLRNNCLEVEGYLQDYKEGFIDEAFFGVLATKIQDILKKDWEERREEDNLQLERLFVLVRNILMVPADPNREQRTEDDASTHDQILWMLHASGLEDLILYVASSDRERSQLCMHIMEIIALVFREQEPQTLASAGVQRSFTEKEKDQRELEQAREREKAQKKANILKYSARHSRFGGTYVLQNIKSISESDVIYHKPLCEVKRFSYDQGKTQKKIGKNRAPIKTEDPKRRSTLSMRMSLKEFCVQFLINAYNPLMRAVKDALTRKSTQDNDETYYLWAMRFFMEFCRLHCRRVDLISETISMSAFHYIYTQLLTYYESLRMGKGEECKVWGRRSHLALKAYQELLRTLDFMSRFPDEQIKESAKVIQSNVFYMMEYRDVFVTLLKNFKQAHCSRAYLRDLVESTHIFLKMLEAFTKSNKNLVVQRKKKKRGKKKKNTQGALAEEMAEPSQEELETIWSENISGLLSSCLQGHEEIPEDVLPFDAASEVDMDQQRIEAMLRIQSSLRDGRAAEAVALFRAAREVWPEREEFGSQEMAEEEEFTALREVYMATLPRPQTQQSTQAEGEDQGDIEEEQNEVEEEEEMAEMDRGETHFDFNRFINDFAHMDVLKTYTILLREFADNSDSVNHCVVKMLHRLTHDLGYVGMLFQASIFKSFNSLINGPYARLPRFKELSKFACFIVRQFTSVAKINKKIFVDMLFWKSKNEALAISSGYDFTSKSKAKVLWTEHQEEELLGLYEKYKDVTHPELDTVELILGELTSDHTRMQVLKELRRQGLITSAKDIKRRGGGSGRSHLWPDDEIQALRDAFEQHKDSNHPIAEIMSTLPKGRSRQAVTSKLLELGLVSDKSDLAKRRKDGSRRGQRRGRHAGSDEEGERLFAAKGRRNRRHSSDDGDASSSSEESEGDDDNSESDDREKEAEVGVAAGQTSCSIGDHVVRLVGQGYEEQLGWICRCLTNTAEDRDEGVCIPTPIVPLTDENETAMEDEAFLSFLRAIGIASPASQQELFWRIPAELSSRDLVTVAKGLALSHTREATNPDEVQRIIDRVLPRRANTSSGPGGQRRKEKKKKKKKMKQKKSKDRGKARSKKSERRNGGDDVQQNGGQSDGSDDSDQEIEPTPFVAKIARVQHGSDTSDSGLDSALEAREQEQMWKERKKKKGNISGADRKKALQAMMERRNNQRKKRAEEREISASSEPGVSAVPNDEPEATNQAMEVDDDGAESVTAEPPGDSPPTRASSASKKRSVQVESDSDTSSLSPLSDSDKEDNNPVSEEDGKKESVQRKSVSSSLSKKRVLDSDSDSAADVPLVKEAQKRQRKKRKSNEDIDLGLSSDEDEKSEARGSGKTQGSDKENKDSESQLDESMRLHFSSSDEEDGGKGDKNKDRSNMEKTEAGKEKTQQKETPLESFPATVLTQDLGSSDEGDHIPLKSAAKRRRAVVFDSDEDE